VSDTILSLIREALTGLSLLIAAHNCCFAGPSGGPVWQTVCLLEVHLPCERASCTISTRTFRVSAALCTSWVKAMRAPRMPSGVFKRT
jgi:hypothetical protein